MAFTPSRYTATEIWDMFWYIYILCGFGTAVGVIDKLISEYPTEKPKPVNVVWMILVFTVFWPAVFTYYVVRWL